MCKIIIVCSYFKLILCSVSSLILRITSTRLSNPERPHSILLVESRGIEPLSKQIYFTLHRMFYLYCCSFLSRNNHDDCLRSASKNTAAVKNTMNNNIKCTAKLIPMYITLPIYKPNAIDHNHARTVVIHILDSGSGICLNGFLL